MNRYDEEEYKLENIRERIYPWVRKDLGEISEKDAPVVSFINDLRIIFVIKREEEVFEILMDDMLPPDCDVEALYYASCENLVRDVEFVIANTWYGGFAILADGRHEASWLCFKHIWQVCVDKLKDDLVIMAPTIETVLFVPASNEAAVAKLIEHGKQAYEQSKDRISTGLMLFTKDRKELTAYED